MRAIDHDHKGHNRGTPFAVAVLPHEGRALRRKLIALADGGEVLVDLPHTVAFETGDVLVLEDGRLVEIAAAKEDLFEITGRDTLHVMELCWHIGNRHLPCAIEGAAHGPKRLLIGRDHVIREMLEGLGAAVRDVAEPFSPVRGAYSDTGHAHGHGGHHHHHD